MSPEEKEAGAKAVAQKGISVGSAQGPRCKDGTRFPEKARKSAQATIRAALRNDHGALR